MPKIFISYRRTDSRTFTDRIHDRLVEVFGADSVFQDVDDIPPGADFRVVLREAVESCDVVLVMIGPQWAGVTDAQGRKRLFNIADFVRIEVQTALDSNKLVIPVLIEGASPPSAEELPETLHELVYRNAINVRHNPDFSRDMERLAKQIKRFEEQLAQRRQAEEQARADAEADDQALQRKAEEKARQRHTEPEATELQRQSQTPPQPTPLPWRYFLKPRWLLLAAGLAAVVIVGVIVIPIIQKSTVVGDIRTISIAHNADWTPVEQDVNGVTMVQVPVGCFDMGNDPQAYYWNDTVWVQGVPAGGHICFDTAFWLDKTEVTNAQFAQFNGKATSSSKWTDPARPREAITWFESRDFCALRGGRLPTEAEWEYAARGPDNLTYPWGNDFVADNVVYSENSNDQTAEVGSKPMGASWVGALDMSGNVWEWVSTLYQPYPYPTPSSSTELQQWINSNNTSNSRILRGGSWSNNFGFTVDLRAAHRGRNGPDNRYDLLGLRCVVSAPLS